MNGCSSFLIGDQKRMVGLMRGTCDLFRLWSLGLFGEKLGVLCLPDGQARLFFGLQKANQLPAQFGQVAALSEEEAQIHENGIFQAADDQALMPQRAAAGRLADNARIVAEANKAGHAEDLSVIQHSG